MRAGPAREALVWGAAFLVLHAVALVVVVALSPAGLDPCGTEGHGPYGVMRAIAGLATLASAAHAAWRLRGWTLVPAGVALVVAVGVWWILLRDPSSFDCGAVPG